MSEHNATLEEWCERQELQRQQEARARFAPPTPAKSSPRKAAGRNDPCPCGSGKTFKKCCLPELETSARN